MERQQILATMGELRLYGMKAAFDEVIKVAVKRSHEPQQVVGDLLEAEIAEKQARSIKYQITIAKLPLAKDVAEFTFAGTPINENLVRELAGGEFLAHQRNVVLVGGTGTGKTHLAIAIARACIRDGARGRFFNVVDLVNRLEAEGRAGRQGRIADYLSRMDFIVLDELGYLPFAQSGGQLLFHPRTRLSPGRQRRPEKPMDPCLLKLSETIVARRIKLLSLEPALARGPHSREGLGRPCQSNQPCPRRRRTARAPPDRRR